MPSGPVDRKPSTRRTQTGELPPDFVDEVIRQWAEEWPDDDLVALALLSRIARLSQFMQRITGQEMQTSGISRGEFYILTTLRRAGPPYQLSAGELARRILSASKNVSVPLRRLEDRGHISRALDPKDRRSIIVSLTEVGRTCVEEILNARRASGDEAGGLLAPLSAEERDTLSYLMKKVLLGQGDIPTTGE